MSDPKDSTGLDDQEFCFVKENMNADEDNFEVAGQTYTDQCCLDTNICTVTERDDNACNKDPDCVCVDPKSTQTDDYICETVACSEPTTGMVHSVKTVEVNSRLKKIADHCDMQNTPSLGSTEKLSLTYEIYNSNIPTSECLSAEQNANPDVVKISRKVVSSQMTNQPTILNTPKVSRTNDGTVKMAPEESLSSNSVAESVVTESDSIYSQETVLCLKENDASGNSNAEVTSSLEQANVEGLGELIISNNLSNIEDRNLVTHRDGTSDEFEHHCTGIKICDDINQKLVEEKEQITSQNPSNSVESEESVTPQNLEHIAGIAQIQLSSAQNLPGGKNSVEGEITCDSEIRPAVISSELEEKILIGINVPDPAIFNLPIKLLGVDGGNIGFIQKITGCIIFLRGKGSYFLEADGKESDEPLHLHVKYKDVKSRDRTRDLIMSLVTGVQKEFDLINGNSLPSNMGEVPYATHYLPHAPCIPPLPAGFPSPTSYTPPHSFCPPHGLPAHLHATHYFNPAPRPNSIFRSPLFLYSNQSLLQEQTLMRYPPVRSFPARFPCCRPMYYPPFLMPPFEPQYAPTPETKISPISNPPVATQSRIPVSSESVSSSTAYASSMETVLITPENILNPDVSMCTPNSTILQTTTSSEVTSVATQFEEVSVVDTKNSRKASSNAIESNSGEPLTENSSFSSRCTANDETESCEKNSSRSDSTANYEADSSSLWKLSTQKSNSSSGETAKPKIDLQTLSDPSVHAKGLPSKAQNSPDLSCNLRDACANGTPKPHDDFNKQKISPTCKRTGLKIDGSFDKPTPPASINIPTSELSTSNKPKTVAVTPNTFISNDGSVITDLEPHVADLDARPHFIRAVNNLSCYYESQYAVSHPLLTANQFQRNKMSVQKDEHSLYKDLSNPVHTVAENQLPLTSEFGNMVNARKVPKTAVRKKKSEICESLRERVAINEELDKYFRGFLCDDSSTDNYQVATKESVDVLPSSYNLPSADSNSRTASRRIYQLDANIQLGSRPRKLDSVRQFVRQKNKNINQGSL